MKEIKILDVWDENIDISWQRENRIKLNKIIRKFNKWQTKHDFDLIKAINLLAYIKIGIDTIGHEDGGSGYLEELKIMESHVMDNVPWDINTPIID